VVHALADVMGEDIIDTRSKFYDSINPVALDRMFSPGGEDMSNTPSYLAFAVNG